MGSVGHARRARRLGAGLVVAGLVGAAAFWGLHAGTRRPPNIVVIAVDSLRADRVGALGSRQDLTPFLDEFAAGSLVYERAYAPSSWTVPVVASLFTGQYPAQHGVTDFFVPLRERTTLAAALAAHGYATSAVSANAAIKGQFGFNAGFERYEVVGEPSLVDPAPDGRLVNDLAVRWVDEVGPEQPHFLYLHYMDVHMPYRSHPGLTPARRESGMRSDDELNKKLIWYVWDFTPDEIWRLEDLYDGEVEYADGMLRELFAALDARGFLDDALVIVTADHGEQFGRHGVFGHGASLHDSVIRVPLLVRLPSGRTGTVSRPVSLAGLAALVLDVADVPRPPSMLVDAVSTRADRAAAAAPTAVRSELVVPGHRSVWKHRHALMLGTHKLLRTTADEDLMFDLARDPLERRPLTPVDPLLRDTLAAALAASPDVADAAEPRQVTPDAATLERLRAAGYLQDP